LVSRGTRSGTRATRFSPGTVSLGTPTIMAGSLRALDDEQRYFRDRGAKRKGPTMP
jgi:hypothetical protein